MFFDPADRELFRRVWALTWPMMVSNALDLAVGLSEFLMVRPFAPAATAAVGASRQVTFLVESMALAVTSGVLTLVSQRVGAGGRRGPSKAPAFPLVEPGHLLRQAAALVVLLGVPVAAAGAGLGGPLLAGLWADDATRAFGEPYLRLYFAGIVLTWGYLLCTALFRGAGDVRTPLKLALGVSLLQVGLNYLFIFGAGPLPELQVQGAALGGLVARTVGLLAFLFLLRRGAGPLYLQDSFVPAQVSNPRLPDEPEALATVRPVANASGSSPGGGRLGLDWPVIGHVLRIGVPMALANVLRHGSRLAYLSVPRLMVALAVPWFLTMAVSVQAALGFALQVRMLGVLVALAFQTAAATLVGQAVGRGDFDQAEAVGRRSVQLLGVVMGTVALLLVVLAGPVAALFLPSPEVAALGARALRWFAVGQLFSSLSIGLQGALMGAGDTLPALRYTLLSEWLVLLPLSAVLAYLEWMPDGMLAAWVLAPALTLFLMRRRFRGGRWKAPRGLS